MYQNPPKNLFFPAQLVMNVSLTSPRSEDLSYSAFIDKRCSLGYTLIFSFMIHRQIIVAHKTYFTEALLTSP